MLGPSWGLIADDLMLCATMVRTGCFFFHVLMRKAATNELIELRTLFSLQSLEVIKE